MEEKKLKIMVIEDDALLLKAISKKLKLEGIDTTPCPSAKVAFNELEKGKPDVIWLDYYLEDMDGHEFMQWFIEKEEWKEIPVVVVSNSASYVKKKEMFDLGIKGYFLKSQYRLDEIIDEIQIIVEKDKVAHDNNVGIS